MRNLLKLSLAVMLFGVFGCSSDDTPAVIPTITFQQDRNIVEPGDEVTFTSTAQDADTYLWDFGDGNTSTDANPAHTYQSTGEFTVTSTVTSSTGDTANSSSSVTVGTRYVLGFTLVSIPDTDPDGKPWDADGSGAELFFGFKPSNISTLNLVQLGNDVTNSQLPITGTYAPEAQIEFTDENWDFLYIDDDDPLGAFVDEEIMGGIVANPITVESLDKDFTAGTGSFNIAAGGYELTIAFTIRNQ